MSENHSFDHGLSDSDEDREPEPTPEQRKEYVRICSLAKMGHLLRKVENFHQHPDFMALDDKSTQAEIVSVLSLLASIHVDHVQQCKAEVSAMVGCDLILAFPNETAGNAPGLPPAVFQTLQPHQIAATKVVGEYYHMIWESVSQISSLMDTYNSKGDEYDRVLLDYLQDEVHGLGQEAGFLHDDWKGDSDSSAL